MTLAAAKPGHKKRSRITLREDVTFLRADSPVNREAGYIENVRVLGPTSVNNRRYLPEAIKKAIPLYEGRKVKINHPIKPGETRPVQTIFGWLEGIYQGSDGALYARKLHFLKTHEMAGPVCEAAERNPALFALSHNAEGKGHYEDGDFVIEEIIDVRSVDIVDEGATNQSLFESVVIPQTLKQLIEASSASAKVKAKLLEMGAMPETDAADAAPLGDTPAPEPAASGSTSPRDALVAAVAACLASADGDDHELALKVMKLLKPGDSAPDGATSDTEEETDANDSAEEGRKITKKPTAELLTEGRVQKLCKGMGLVATAEVLEATIGSTLDQGLAILGLVARKAEAAKVSAPRSSGVRPIPEGQTPKDAKSWASRLLN